PGVFTGPETVGPKGRKGTEKTTVATGTPSQTSPDRPEQRTYQKAIQHGSGGSNDALTREGPRPTGGQNGPGGPRDPGASRHDAAPRGEDGNGGPGHYDRREGPRGPQGPGGTDGPGPYAGPHGPGGPQGGGQVAQDRPRSQGKPNQHDQEIDSAEQPR